MIKPLKHCRLEVAYRQSRPWDAVPYPVTFKKVNKTFVADEQTLPYNEDEIFEGYCDRA